MLGNARITADVVNSYMCYPVYSGDKSLMSEAGRDSFFLSLKDELKAPTSRWPTTSCSTWPSCVM